MSTELIINASLPETRIALMESGEIQDLLIERAQGKGIVGNIYKGRVTRVLPGMQAAFVDIGLEKAAFLYVDDVYVHSEIWEEEEETNQAAVVLAEVHASEVERAVDPAADPGIKIHPRDKTGESAEDPAQSGVNKKSLTPIISEGSSAEVPESSTAQGEASAWEEEVA